MIDEKNNTQITTDLSPDLEFPFHIIQRQTKVINRGIGESQGQLLLSGLFQPERMTTL